MTRLLGKTAGGREWWSYLLTCLTAAVSVLVVAYYHNPEGNQVLVGWLIIVTSLTVVARVRKTKFLFYLLSIISYINVSVAVTDCIYGGEAFAAYQWVLRHSTFGEIYGKCILLTVTVLSLLITPGFIASAAQSETVLRETPRPHNSLITYGGIFLICVVLLRGLEVAESQAYASNTDPLYEYAILLFMLSWFYSGNRKNTRLVFLASAAVYIIQGLYYGDRSSALVLVVFLGMVYLSKPSPVKMMVFALLSVLFANLIAIYRDNPGLKILDLVARLLDRGLLIVFSDTAGMSFYAGITIVASRLLLPRNPMYYLGKFILSVFLGGSSALTLDSDLTRVVRQNLYNAGGGLYPSYFYFWGSYLGVVLGAMILGFIVRKVFAGRSAYSYLLRLSITVMSLRWYLYAPLPLFRAAILVFSAMYLLCIAIRKCSGNRHTRPNYSEADALF